MMKDGFGRITVEYNRMERLGLECADTAAVMSESWFVLPDDPDLGKGLVIRHNLIRDVIGCAAYGTPMKRDYVRGTRAGGRIWTPYFNWGIYSDNTGMSILVSGNIVAGTVLGGVSLPVGNPTDILIENNVFVDALASQADLQIGGGWTKGEGASGNRFVRNVIFYTTGDAALLNTTEQTRTAFAECDHNLYWPAAGQTPVVNGVPDGSFEAPGGSWASTATPCSRIRCSSTTRTATSGCGPSRRRSRSASGRSTCIASGWSRPATVGAGSGSERT